MKHTTTYFHTQLSLLRFLNLCKLDLAGNKIESQGLQQLGGSVCACVCACVCVCVCVCVCHVCQCTSPNEQVSGPAAIRWKTFSKVRSLLNFQKFTMKEGSARFLSVGNLILSIFCVSLMVENLQQGSSLIIFLHKVTMNKLVFGFCDVA